MNLRTSPHLRNSSDCCLYKFYCSDFSFREFLTLEDFSDNSRFPKFFLRLLGFAIKTSSDCIFYSEPSSYKMRNKIWNNLWKKSRNLENSSFCWFMSNSSYCRKLVNYEKSKLKSYILTNFNLTLPNWNPSLWGILNQLQPTKNLTLWGILT